MYPMNQLQHPISGSKSPTLGNTDVFKLILWPISCDIRIFNCWYTIVLYIITH